MVAGGVDSQDIDINDPIVKRMLETRENHARNQEKDYSHVFRSKSRFEFIRLSCIVVAIELAYSAETAFVSPILLQIGVDHKHMTMIWGLSPLLGFFVSPILGSLSDRCRSSLGRRRPIIIGLSIGILCGLLLVPYGKALGTLLGEQAITLDDNFNGASVVGNVTIKYLGEPRIVETSLSNHMVAFAFTVLGTILLDFDADTCQTPARAYLLDVCIPSDHARAMSTFSIMAGLGGTFGYALGAVDWNSTYIGVFFGGNYQTVFVIVIVVFIICFTITVTSFREIPLGLIENDYLLRPLTASSIRKEIQKNKRDIVYYIKEATSMELKLSSMQTTNSEKVLISAEKLNNNIINGSVNGLNNNGSEVSLKVSQEDDEEDKVTLRTYLKSIIIMPKSIRILSLTNLFCHMAHLSYCLYFTDFVGEAVFGGDPSAMQGSTQETLYNEGVRFGCWGLSMYAFSCSLYSTMIEKFISWTNTKTVYVGGILAFAVGMLILAIWPTKAGVIVFSVPAGIVYSTLFTMPFILIAKYHSQGRFNIDPSESLSLKHARRGLGTDIAIISSMVFVGQLIISLSMGPLISLVGSTSAILYVASGSAILAAVSALNVLYLD